MPTITRATVLTGDEPGRVIRGPLGRAFVALRGAGVVTELDVANATVVARHVACGAPRGMGWSATRSSLYVACATGTLARLFFEPAIAVTKRLYALPSRQWSGGGSMHQKAGGPRLQIAARCLERREGTPIALVPRS